MLETTYQTVCEAYETLCGTECGGRSISTRKSVNRLVAAARLVFNHGGQIKRDKSKARLAVFGVLETNDVLVAF